MSYLFPLGAQTLFATYEVVVFVFVFFPPTSDHVMKHNCHTQVLKNTIQLGGDSSGSPVNHPHVHNERAALLVAALTHYSN